MIDTEQNKLGAGLCKRAVDWCWSSAQSYVNGQNDKLVIVKPMFERADDCDIYFDEPGAAENTGDSSA